MNTHRPRRITAVIAAAALVGGVALIAAPASAAPVSPAAPTTAHTAPAAPAPLTNLAHLDFLLDTATPPAQSGHSTYKLDSEPAITMPWTYANANGDGTFTRVGGGPLDPATGHYGQGAFDADDITRAAVVYLRDWKLTGSASSKQKAYELLRSVAYFQTTTGPDAGNVVLWMQSDGTFNPSPTPVELPDPSDSGPSYWLARTLWALGEGYADFRDSDPAFASFLQQRVQLGVAALNREVLNKYGQYAIADGTKVPAWLIVDGADASSEAVLGLAAYSAAAPADSVTRTALRQLSEGIAQLGSGSTQQWPYGAILPSADSRSMWHAYLSQMPAALAVASTTLRSPSLLAPAVADSADFSTVLLTSGGPDNAWYPAPVDTTQIAYGADSRLESQLAVAKATGRQSFVQLAGLTGAWFFGANKSGQPVYDPATGVTFDGVQPDGSINRNSGAESTIHGLLAMIALDGNPAASALAQASAKVTGHDGLTVVEGEKAASTTGTVVTPSAAWTGESQFSGGAYLSLAKGTAATFDLGPSTQARRVEPVILEPQNASATSVWSTGGLPLGLIRSGVGAQGVSAAPGALLPQQLTLPLPPSKTKLTVTDVSGTTNVDALLVRPLVSRLDSTGSQLLHSASLLPAPATVGAAGRPATVRSYDASGVLVQQRAISGTATVLLRAGGFAVVTFG